MVSEMTGSASPMLMAHPAATPSLSRSKRGRSIDAIPSLRGPPDLISSSGTVCCEKSVRGHSARQPPGSARAVPGAVPMAAATSVAASTAGRMPFRKLNCAPLGSLIARLSASIAICPDVDVGDSLDRLKRLPVGCATTAVPPQLLHRQDASDPLVFERDQYYGRHISDTGSV